jgi:lipopolysaccharide biosynthesis glycosyltransferase
MWSPTRWIGRRREPLRVACTSDEGYLPHCAATLHSVIVSQPGPVEAHLLAGPDLTLESEQRLSDWVESLGAGLTVHRIDDPEERFRGIAPNLSLNSWFRVLLPELLPDSDKVLYLDSDVIVVDSLEPLLRLDLSGKCIAAVTNPPITLEWMQAHSAALGLPATDDYFNAGVMLMNLAELRAGNWMDRVIEYGVAHADRHRDTEIQEDSPREVFIYTMKYPERLLFTDQDALNAVLHEVRLKLHPRWNVQTLFRRSAVRTEELTERRVAEALSDLAIRHFEGPGHSKPWHRAAEFPDDVELYTAHRRETPWPAF